MSTEMNTLSIIVAVFGVILSGGVSIMGYDWYQTRKEKADAAARLAAAAEAENNRCLNTLCGQIASLSLTIQGIQKSMEDGGGSFASLLEGIAMVCKSQSDTLDKLTSAVELLQQSMSPDHAAKDYEEFATETPAAIRAMEEQEIRDIMRRDRGLSREDAEGKVHERRIYEQMARGR